jgi:hypothetical protein
MSGCPLGLKPSDAPSRHASIAGWRHKLPVGLPLISDVTAASLVPGPCRPSRVIASAMLLVPNDIIADSGETPFDDSVAGNVCCAQ